MSPTRVFAAGLATLAVVTALSGCGDSPAAPEGYYPIDDAAVATMPKESITAVVNGSPRDRASIEVDSPAACLQASRTMSQTSKAAGSTYDYYANCMARDGKARLLVIRGTPYAPGRIVTP